MPCQHMARLCEVFREISDGHWDIRSTVMVDTLPILSLFSTYWHKSQADWLRTVPSHRAKRDSGYSDEDDDCPHAHGGDEGIRGGEQVEMTRTQDALNLANQSVRAAVTLGPHVLIYLRDEYAQINASLMENKIPVLWEEAISQDDLLKLKNPNPGPGGIGVAQPANVRGMKANEQGRSPLLVIKRKG